MGLMLHTRCRQHELRIQLHLKECMVHWSTGGIVAILTYFPIHFCWRHLHTGSKQIDRIFENAKWAGFRMIRHVTHVAAHKQKSEKCRGVLFLGVWEADRYLWDLISSVHLFHMYKASHLLPRQESTSITLITRVRWIENQIFYSLWLSVNSYTAIPRWYQSKELHHMF